MKDWRHTTTICFTIALAAIGLALCILQPWKVAVIHDTTEIRLAVARIHAAVSVSTTPARFTELAGELQAQSVMSADDLTEAQKAETTKLVSISSTVARIWSTLATDIDKETLDQLQSIGAISKEYREKLRSVNYDLVVADLRAGGFSKSSHEAVAGLRKSLISAALTVVGNQALRTWDTISKHPSS